MQYSLSLENMYIWYMVYGILWECSAISLSPFGKMQQDISDPVSPYVEHIAN